MLIYLDSVIVIYAIEGDAALQQSVKSRIAAASITGDQFATSDLTRLECLIRPLRLKDTRLRAAFTQFLAGTAVLGLSPPVFDLAAQARADHRLSVTDALHLATAILGNCGLFLTNDARLAKFPQIAVETMP
jgi:predicted nucleic acid-binding protein